jgi:hypothetical protein
VAVADGAVDGLADGTALVRAGLAAGDVVAAGAPADGVVPFEHPAARPAMVTAPITTAALLRKAMMYLRYAINGAAGAHRRPNGTAGFLAWLGSLRGKFPGVTRFLA